MPKSYVLLVDDEPQNLFLISELLEMEGYATELATSGEEALRQANEERPALVLLDVMMPGMDGFEVCHQLRENPNLNTVPIIFLTALDDEESRLKSMDVLSDDYFTKPIRAEILLRRIQSVLQLQDLRNQASQQAISAQEQLLQQARDRYDQKLASILKVSDALSEKFQLFVPQQFLRRVAPRGVDSIQVGNAMESTMTVLFCDIRNFTKIVEFQQARQTFEWLNAFFERINQAIADNHGFVDKFMGDAVMAVFDQPEQHSTDAVHAAIAICRQVETFNSVRAQFSLADPLQIGIGIHTGRGIIGTVGADLRMDTTVVGDVVNTASRLEEMTKIYRCQVIASDSVASNLPADHPFQVRWLDEVIPRGKQSKLGIYQILSRADSPSKNPAA